MAYEVSAAAEQSERLVVSAGGATLLYGEPLDSDREAAADGDVIIVAEQENGIYSTLSADVASDLQLLQERVPEVAAAVKVEHIPEVEAADEAEQVVTTVEPADPADSVVPAGETTPALHRDVAEAEAGASEARDEDANPQVENPSDEIRDPNADDGLRVGRPGADA